MNMNSAANSAPATMPAASVPSRASRGIRRSRAQASNTAVAMIERTPACRIGEMPALATLIVICWNPQHMHSTTIMDTASASAGLRSDVTIRRLCAGVPALRPPANDAAAPGPCSPLDPPRVEGPAPLRPLRLGQYVAVQPQAVVQRQRIAFGQPGLAHLLGRRGEFVIEGVVLDAQSAAAWHDGAVPGARRAVVGRHADGAGVVPEPAIDDLGEGQPAVAAKYAVAAAQRDLFALDRDRRRGKDIAADVLQAAVYHGQTASSDFQMQPARQRAHPGARVIVEHAAGESVPPRREPVAGTAFLES